MTYDKATLMLTFENSMNRVNSLIIDLLMPVCIAKNINKGKYII